MVAKTRRYCPRGHIFDYDPYNPCCALARAPGQPKPPKNRTWAQRGRKRPWPKRRAQVRDFIRLRDSGRCRYCGGAGGEIDHVMPRSNKGSESAFENLVWSCHSCNMRKGREVGFTMNHEHLYWHGRLVAPGHLFGEPLLQEIEAQRRTRQVAQGLNHIIEFKENQKSP